MIAAEKDESQSDPALGELEHYGEPGIASFDAPIPKFLLAVYAILPVCGIVAFYYFWNGTVGWLDGGRWRELQIAANTTFPVEHHDDPDRSKPAAQQLPDSR